MLSRVAAVKAPCTHNRRRVTGSSGRRREGRESEPQRPNMSRHLFYSAVLLVLVVMMFCCGSGAASNEKTLTDSELPKRKLFVWRDTTDEVTVDSLRVPSLLKVNGDVFAVAEALFTRGVEGSFTGIASELLALTDQQRKELDKTKLKTQVLGKCSSGKEECPTQAVDQAGTKSGAQALVSKPTTVVHGSDIYMLAGTYNLDGVAAAGEDITDEWGLLLARGNVSIVEDGRNKRIYWTDVDALPITSNTEQYGYVTELLGSGGSGVKMEDGTLVFPMEGEVYRTVEADEENTAGGGYTVSLFIYFPDNNSWKLSKGMSADGCGVPSVVEWEKDKLMMMTACDDGRRVYESGDKGDSWTEALGTLSRVWGNDEGNVWSVRSGFTTAKIGDNRDVMLVILPVYSSKDGNGKGELHLWLTDNTHIVDIGPVSEEDDDVTTSFLLYKSAGSGDGDNKDEELIALYEKKKKVNHELSHDMVTVRLTAQLERVKEVLTTWKKVDERVSQLCTTLLAEKVALTEIACTTDKITDGLVGFLSGNFSENTWRDEYLGVNATVKGNDGATKTSDGVTFQGAWAEWPVGSQGQNQLYHFANYNFTLVATVSIDGEPKGDTPIPLLGAKMAGVENNPVLLGLSYNGGGKWQLLCGDETNKEISSTWKRGTKHQVAIVLRNGTHGSAYVDGVRVGEDAQCQLENTDSEGISHLYIGGDGGIADNTESREGVFVTVTNVLLYNRLLTFSGGNAEVEEVTDSPSAEPASPFVARNQNAAPPATIPPEAPVEQTTLQQPQHEGKGQNATAEESATAQELPANTSQGSVEKAAVSSSHAVGEATVDGGTMRESRLLPSLLLLLGLWGFAAL
ncbi:putative trans-sialidase, Group VI [Trypanosoma cruzi]|uniref:Trans-sialidase, putative n=2 Tax=Trypanosoma cruzi TaxID=5693 RepID=Q4E5K1_TRYCC|nr:trans-sialidase, putative [Trypanosoma cruzi]EAO00059.1 trans-sialidase, putative [Trypanosoma cruzi]PWV06137.1 putative trans-sialidase, Group VI [Trypanosoma cruzi]|eukprot:XP_821910.1 trans-sialidase [Trypanosoma cruzi strain CL Brener]